MSSPQVQAVHAIVAEAVASAPSGDRHVQAAVTAVDASGKATVKWAGRTFGAKRSDDYAAVVGDQVLVVIVAGSSPIILCKIV